MDRSIPAIITALVLLGLLALMLRSWRRRSRRDAALTAGYPRPDEAAADEISLATAEAYYVATTPRDTPLERLAIPGLGFRARAALTVSATGVTVDLDGNAPLYIPAQAIDGVGAAQVAIDRVVETDGLVRLSWRLNSPASAADRRAVDSFFRIIDPNDRARLVDSIRTTAATATGPAAHDESEA